MKAIQKNAAVVDAESYRPELVENDEPRYLRRQKPVEIRRKKFGGKNLSRYRTIFNVVLITAGCGVVAYVAGNFLLHSPKVLLLKPEQVEVNGNHIVSREAVLAPFYKDRGHSVLRIPLDARRTDVEKISWVQSASVQRILPNRIRIDISERSPIAFVRNGGEIGLIDEFGKILDRSHGEDFHFPIVTGLTDSMSDSDRQKRMQTFQEFLKDADLVRSASSDHISEVDLGNPHDLRVVMAGIPGVNATQAITIHFGSGEFTGKYRMLVENFAQWQSNAGCVQSVDLQYARQVVLNPDSTGCGDHTTVKKK
ncbi:MAG TPA: FtsQ-type POTRA domain-containing protein [Lacipirellulaceae bacterium]|nr:FtsQ-type POTRA domain-containing protein [Lacipirellulaceae bacterium]